MSGYITGSNGFIGHHLMKKLDGITPILHQDIEETELKSFDYFYFLSSYGNLAHQTNVLQIFKSNIIDVLTILLKIKSSSFKSFVFLSSSSVMLKNQTTYSRSKKAAEEILLGFMEKYNLPVCIIRPFSVTGVGEQKEHLIPTLINAAFTGKQVNLVPHATHDFIDVEDVVEGILSLSNNSARGIYQLGTGIKTTNMEVLQIVEKLTSKKIKVNLVDSLRPYDNDNWVSTNFKARGWGWMPRKTLEQSISEMIKAYEYS